MKFRFDWKNYVLGLLSMFVILIVPVISEPFISLITKIRDKIGGKK